MDNLTHSLIGLTAAKAGLERLSPYAVPICVLAANAPDADIVTRLAGSSIYLHQHRGISHSIVGTLVIALVLPLLFYGFDRLYARWRGVPPRAKLGGLTLASLVTCVSHPLLDWTNNYGVRPFLPWQPTWYYGDLIFIIDPWLWLSLGGACFLLTAKSRPRLFVWAILAVILTAVLFLLPSLAGFDYPLSSKVLWVAGLAGWITAYLFRAGDLWGRTVAVIALALIIAYWGALSVFHQRAFQQLEQIAGEMVAPEERAALKMAAMPLLGTPLRWMGVIITPREAYRLNLDVGGRVYARESFPHPQGREAELAAIAARDPRARIFLEFSRFPLIDVRTDCASQTLVQFADLRYTQPGGRGGSFNLEVKVQGDAR
jgi:inner membrane protein